MRPAPSLSPPRLARFNTKANSYSGPEGGLYTDNIGYLVWYFRRYGSFTVNIQCDREDALFMAVSEMARLVSPKKR